MKPWMIGAVFVAVGLIALVAYAFPKLAAAFARDRALARCDELQRARSQAAVQGGDPVLLARLDSEIRACTQTASSLGAELDLGEATLTGCVAKGEQINQEFAHYRATTYDDPVKRKNTRSTMLRLGEEMARCFSGAIDDSETPATLTKIRNALAKAIAESEARERCYLDDASGCGRFGVSEEHGNDKGRDERQRVIEPLRAQYDRATAKLDELTAASRASSTAASSFARLNPSLLASAGAARFAA